MALDQGVARRPEETEKSLGIKVAFWGITFVKGWISPKFPKAVQDLLTVNFIRIQEHFT